MKLTSRMILIMKQAMMIVTGIMMKLGDVMTSGCGGRDGWHKRWRWHSLTTRPTSHTLWSKQQPTTQQRLPAHPASWHPHTVPSTDLQSPAQIYKTCAQIYKALPRSTKVRHTSMKVVHRSTQVPDTHTLPYPQICTSLAQISDLHKSCTDLQRCCTDPHKSCRDLHDSCTDPCKSCRDLHKFCTDPCKSCRELHKSCTDLHKSWI